MTTVCLCGSARFEQAFVDANRELTLLGLTVISLGVLPRDAPNDKGKNWYTVEQKAVLDLVHLNKILQSDAVLIVGDGYIGESTSREIIWSIMQGKSVLRACDFTSYYDIGAAICANLSMPEAMEYAVAALKGELKQPEAPAGH